MQRFLDGARRLKDHLGPILYQLPPNWKKNLPRLKSFAELLPSELIHVIEFRDRDWLADDTYELMAEHDLCLCVHDMLPRHPRRVTGPAAQWKINDDGFSAVEGGLAKTYRRGRKALRKAYENSRTEHFHEWSKRVKYHWYHARLLRRIWPAMMNVWRGATDQLSDLLGDDHDLAVFRQTLLDDPTRRGERVGHPVS